MKKRMMLMLVLFGAGCGGGSESPETETTAAPGSEPQAMSGMDTQAGMEGMAGM